MERRLTAQVTRQDSKLRQINDELEDRTRLLERARVSVDTQAAVARAVAAEHESARLARERLEANALRISELERELATARGDDRTRDDETHALRVRVATLEEQLDERADDVERLEGELALRASTAESHRANAVEAAKSIDDLHERLRAAESVAADAVTRAENVEGEGATLNATSSTFEPTPPLPRYEKTDSETTSPRFETRWRRRRGDTKSPSRRRRRRCVA